MKFKIGDRTVHKPTGEYGTVTYTDGNGRLVGINFDRIVYYQRRRTYDTELHPNYRKFFVGSDRNAFDNLDDIRLASKLRTEL